MISGKILGDWMGWAGPYVFTSNQQSYRHILNLPIQKFLVKDGLRTYSLSLNWDTVFRNTTLDMFGSLLILEQEICPEGIMVSQGLMSEKDSGVLLGM